MTYHNAAKRLTTAPQGSDPRSAERVSLLCRALSLPKKGTAVIRVLGSSGKSACATMLARALFSRGYCVGTLTTPFSHTMTECMTVNCEPVSMDCFTRNVSLVMETASSIDKQISNATNFAEEQDEALSPFEKAMSAYVKHGVPFSPFGDELLLTSALSCFSEAGCQLVIVEIPNGERAGAYRLPFAPLLNVITGADGEEDAAILCHYLDKRAKETVTALQSKEIYRIISDACAKINCRLSMPLRNSFYPADFAANRMRFFYKNAERNLNSGAYYQALNMLTVSEVLEALQRQGVSADPLACDFHPPVGNAGIELQFAFLSIRPTVVTDFADNKARLEAFATSLAYQSALLGERICMVTEENGIDDQTITDVFAKHGIRIEDIVRVTVANGRKTLKPIISALTSENTVLITGSRPFVYEITRTVSSLMA